jgi:hypothetical protein
LKLPSGLNSSIWPCSGKNVQHDLPVGSHVHGVAAEPPRLQHAVEPGLGELLVQFRGVVADPLSLVGLRDDVRDQRLGAGDKDFRRQVRLGNRHGTGGRGAARGVGAFLDLLWHSTEPDPLCGRPQGVLGT